MLTLKQKQETAAGTTRHPAAIQNGTPELNADSSTLVRSHLHRTAQAETTRRQSLAPTYLPVPIIIVQQVFGLINERIPIIIRIEIEFISNIIVRPFSLTVRLFANMLAGHILLVTFALLTQSLITAETKVLLLKPMAVLPFFMLVFLTAFEVLVAFLQAYIFTILTAVYIGGALHPEH